MSDRIWNDQRAVVAIKIDLRKPFWEVCRLENAWEFRMLPYEWAVANRLEKLPTYTSTDSGDGL